MCSQETEHSQLGTQKDPVHLTRETLLSKLGAVSLSCTVHFMLASNQTKSKNDRWRSTMMRISHPGDCNH